MGKKVQLSIETVVAMQHLVIALENNPNAKERVMGVLRDNNVVNPEARYAAMRREVLSV